MLLMVTSGNTDSRPLAMVIGLNIGVLGLFSLESVTMAELFGSRTRFTQLALAKEIGGILATAIGPVVAATLTAVTGSWWPHRRHAHRLLADHPGVRRCRPRDPRPRPGPAGGRGMKAVVVHGADDLRIDERPDPVAGPGEVLIAVEWGGICGSDLSYWRHGASGTARAEVTRWCSATRWPAASPQLGAGVTGLEVGQPVTVHPAELVGDGMPARAARRPHQPLPADPLLRIGGFRPAHRRRVQRTGSWSAPTQIRPLPDGVGHRARGAGRTARRRPARRGRAGDARAAATCWSTGPARSARWWSPRPSTGARTVVATDIAEASLTIATAMGADEVRNLAAGDTLPEDAELVFEASGAPAALGGVAPRDRPRRHPRPGRQPARHPRPGRPRRPGDPGDHLDRLLPVRRRDHRRRSRRCATASTSRR